MDTIYSADQIVGKALYAKVPVGLKRIAEDSAAIVATVDAGNKVGDVYAWLDYKPGVRDSLYWMFYDSKQVPYYAKHAAGTFDVDILKDQGALTVKEQIAAEAEKNKSIVDKIIDFAQKNVTTIIVIGGAYFGLKLLLSGNKKK